MIIRLLLRRPNAVQSLASAPARRISPPSRRLIHNPPSLQNHKELVENGIPGLLSRDGFDIAWTQYQKHILEQLNESTAGTEFENKRSQSLVIEFARNPVTAHQFNAASMAWNNHFFFKGIATDPNVTSAPSSDLVRAINNSFSSFDTLRETFLATAEAMFGPGFVWLVQTKDGSHRPLRILTTYIAGSPLSGAHYRRQSNDLNNHNSGSYQRLNPVGTFGSAAEQITKDKKDEKPLGGVDVVPLLCVNTWQHVWLHDYGVTGKTRYLEAWWDRINWNVVQDGADLTMAANQRFQFVY